MNRNSDKSMVMATQCIKCGVKGYIFPDQIEHGKTIMPRQMTWAKCCNGRVNKQPLAECKGYIDSARAMRLQNIRLRETTIDPEAAVANF